MPLKTMAGGFKGFAATGLLAGVLWGWFSMAANAVSGVFQFEATFLLGWASFTLAGGLFGLVVAGAVRYSSGMLPFKGVLGNSVLVSVAFWLVLRVGGALLSGMEPERYHVIKPEMLQGLVLAAVLGAMVGLTGRMLASGQGATADGGR